jgi:hypothetical protein
MPIIYDFKCIWAGFYSQLFFFLQSYILCKINNEILLYDDSQWKFKHTFGLADYFVLDESKIKFLQITDENRGSNVINFHNPDKMGVIFPLQEYRTAIKELYVINDDIREKTNQLRSRFPEKYNAIFIRWGDKKIEIKASGRNVEIELYVDALQRICGNNRHLFVHSDDHNAVLSVLECMKHRGMHGFNVFYITGEDECGGTLACEIYRQSYPDKTKKSIEQMSIHEMREHTEKMLVAIEIMGQAENVILDYQSNVARFLKLYYDESHCKVHSVFNDAPDENILCIPPAFGFEIDGYVNVPPSPKPNYIQPPPFPMP